MSDLVNELRQGSLNKDDYRWKAADRIEQLEAALRDIASGKYSGIVLTSYPPQDPAVNAARAALEEHT